MPDSTMELVSLIAKETSQAATEMQKAQADLLAASGRFDMIDEELTRVKAAAEAAINVAEGKADAAQATADIILQDDLAVTKPPQTYFTNFPYVTMNGGGHTLTLASQFSIFEGSFVPNNITFAVGDGLPCFISVGGALSSGVSVRIDNNVVFSGAVSNASIESGMNATVTIYGSLSGTVTGKRYSCVNGGRIFTLCKGENAIPGTKPGTCDANSVYA